MTDIVFRTDASPSTGMGHLMRCLALGRAMGEAGVYRLLSRPDVRLDDMLTPVLDAGWQVSTLPDGLDDAQDAAATAEQAETARADLVITDLCSRAFIDRPDRLSRYHTALRACCSQPVLSIEDCRMTAFTSDIAIVPYECGNPDLPARAEEGCVLKAGGGYYVGDARLAERRAERRIEKEVSRVLVSIGGSDAQGFAVDVARAFSLATEWTPEVRILVGRGMTLERRAELDTACAGRPNLEVVDFTDDMGALLVWADIAILGEGLVRFEAAITGTPSVTISQVEHDSGVLKHFYGLGVTRYLGRADRLSGEEIVSGVRALAEDAGARRRQSETGMRLYDGGGTARIAELANQLAKEGRQCRH